MADNKEFVHPLDRQNALERAIQLEGSKDPDNFKMPDGRTLTEVRQSNYAVESANYQEEIRMVAQRTREQSIPEFQKGDKLVMTSTGNLIDVTEPIISEDTVTMAKSRTTSSEIAEGVIQPRQEGLSNPSTAGSGESADSSGNVTETSTGSMSSGNENSGT